MSTQMVQGSISIDSLLAFSFGVIFVICLLIFAVAIPNPTDFTAFVFRVVLSLAAAGVGAVLPGLLEVTLPGVRAGGAMALAAVVYFMNPPALIHDTIESKTKSALDGAYARIARGNIELGRDFIERAKLMTPEPIDIPFLSALSIRDPTNLRLPKNTFVSR
jgi:hypothetical protein